MGQMVDRERIVKGVVQKEGKLYLIHKKYEQGRINVLVDCLGDTLQDQLQYKHLNELYWEALRGPRRRLGINNKSLKSYSDALIARFGNLQDDGEMITKDKQEHEEKLDQGKK